MKYPAFPRGDLYLFVSGIDSAAARSRGDSTGGRTAGSIRPPAGHSRGFRRHGFRRRGFRRRSSAGRRSRCSARKRSRRRPGGCSRTVSCRARSSSAADNILFGYTWSVTSLSFSGNAPAVILCGRGRVCPRRTSVVPVRICAHSGLCRPARFFRPFAGLSAGRFRRGGRTPDERAARNSAKSRPHKKSFIFFLKTLDICIRFVVY